MRLSRAGIIIGIIGILGGCGSGDESSSLSARNGDIVSTGAGRWDRPRTLQEEVRFGMPDGDERYLFGRPHVGPVLPGDTLVVADTRMRTVRLYDSGGAFVRQIGRIGDGPGEFRSPGVGLARGDTLYVFDGASPRVALFTSDGRAIGLWRTPIRAWNAGVVLEAAEGFWIAQMFGEPVIGETRRVGYIRYHGGAPQADTLHLPNPSGDDDPWRVGGGGRSELLMYNSRAYVLEVRGQHGLVRRFGRADVPPRRRTAEQLATLRDSERRRAARSTEAASTRERPIPEVADLIRRAWIDADRRTWVEVLVDDDAWRLAGGGACTATPPGDERSDRVVLDVFDASGVFLGRTAQPCGAEVHGAQGERAWGFHRSADDVPVVVRWRIAH